MNLKQKVQKQLIAEYNGKVQAELNTLKYHLRSSFNSARLEYGLLFEEDLYPSANIKCYSHRDAIQNFLTRYKELTIEYQAVIDDLEILLNPNSSR